MFNRFTRGARQTVERAQVEARALGHDCIGTEHLLLGIAAGTGRATTVLADHGATVDALRIALREEYRTPLDAQALASLGIDLDEIRRRAEAAFGPGALERGHRRRRRGHLRFTPPAKKALELALREALAAGDNHIDAEHVLLGLLRDEKAAAVAVLRRTGAPAEAVREALKPAAKGR
jgi:ATP-dependent Clp protease ATP-binding subunit ClpA